MMRITFSFFLCLLLACSLTTTNAVALEPPKEFKEGQPDSIQITTSLSQHGITWTFAKPAQYGQFVNGDYWVVAADDGVKVIKITPNYTLYNGTRPENGSMINPGDTKQGYDGTLSGQYDASLNVAIGVSESTPLILTANKSLVSTISFNPTSGTNNSYVHSAAVLTCLSAPPPEGTFRPGISSSTKTLHNINSVNTALLKSLAYPSGQPRLDITSYANYFRMVWLAHSGNNLVRYMHPAASGLDNYYYPSKFAEAALLLHMDYTPQEKLPLLINYIQLGIDLYSYLESGAIGWWPDGGHAMGRKWPILFAGIMLDYSPMKTIGQVSGDYLYASGYGPGNSPPDYKYFGEDGQTFYVTQADVNRTTNSQWVSDSWRSGGFLNFDLKTLTFNPGSPGGASVGPWNPDTRNQTAEGAVRCRPYSVSMIGMPEWGITFSSNPYRNDSSWSAYYRHTGTIIPSWAGITLAAKIMGSKSLWNNNAFFDYTDRYMAISKGEPDPFGFAVFNQSAGNRPTGFIGTMWDTYRKNY